MPGKPGVFQGKLVKPKGLELDIVSEEKALVFGQRSFLNWLLFSLFSKLQDCRNDLTQPLKIKLLLSYDIECRYTELSLNYDGAKVMGQTEECLDCLLQLLALCLAEYQKGSGYISLRFLNLDLDDRKLTNISDRLLIDIHNDYLKSAMEFSALGGILHDLKNSLLVLKRNLGSSNDDPSQYTINFVTAKASCLEKAESLGTYFKNHKPNYSHINLLDFSGTLTREIRKLAPQGCKVNFSFTKLLTDEVISDGTMLNSIIMNLAKNSIESISENGLVAIDFTVEHEDELIITINDNGCGIPKDTVPKLFDTFFTTKANKRGTGLGLPTVKRLVDLLDGVIEVESEVGMGTKISILIPLKVPTISIEN